MASTTTNCPLTTTHPIIDAPNPFAETSQVKRMALLEEPPPREVLALPYRPPHRAAAIPPSSPVHLGTQATFVSLFFMKRRRDGDKPPPWTRLPHCPATLPPSTPPIRSVEAPSWRQGGNTDDPWPAAATRWHQANNDAGGWLPEAAAPKWHQARFLATGFTLLGLRFTMGFTLLGPGKHSRNMNLPEIEYPVLANTPKDKGSVASA